MYVDVSPATVDGVLTGRVPVHLLEPVRDAVDQQATGVTVESHLYTDRHVPTLLRVNHRLNSLLHLHAVRPT